MRWLDSSRACCSPGVPARGLRAAGCGAVPASDRAGNVRFGARGEGRADTAIDMLEIRGLLDRYPVVALRRGEAARRPGPGPGHGAAAAPARRAPGLARRRVARARPPVPGADPRGVEDPVSLRDPQRGRGAGHRGAPGAAARGKGRGAGAAGGAAGRRRRWRARPKPASRTSSRAASRRTMRSGVSRRSRWTAAWVAVPLATDRAPGSPVTLAIRAEDVLVAAEPMRGISARNVYQARVAALERTGVDIMLRCALTEVHSESVWLVRVTPAAVEDLALASGQPCGLRSRATRFASFDARSL